METAYAKIKGAEIYKSDLGTIEYTVSGEGQPLLIIHGAGGGFNQGEVFGKLLGDGLKIIAVSRFGYLSSPMPESASVALQADMYAELIESLEIGKTAIMGMSAGGPSCLQFALRHQDKCSHLIMLCALSIPNPKPEKLKLIFRYMFSSDYRYWRATRKREKMLKVLGTSPEVIAAMTNEEIAFVDNFLATMHPMNLRYEGVKNEGILFWSPESYPLNQITAPALVFHAKDDGLVNISHSRYTAENIPNAKLIEFDSGGHLMIGHTDELAKFIKAFIE